jgi:biofilm PGA synthesis N-glycosyltransferase PgaC
VIGITLSIPELILFILFSIAFLIQAWYYLGVFRLFSFGKTPEKKNSFPPVSVVICARNEENNLQKHLPAILSQDYPEYEVVVVNDCSFDQTEDLLKTFSAQYDRMKIVTIKEDEYYSHGKKFAQMVGIKGAKYEHLLFTDADCQPASKEWIKEMAGNFDEKTDIILGYGAYEKTKGWLNKLIRFDTFYIALQYFSFALAGNPYMGVGRNLAYKKSLFFKNKGFASHYHIESGDDDLFVNETATTNNCVVEANTKTHTHSVAKKTYSEWSRQKKRHLTTASHYKTTTKRKLGLLTGSQYLFFTSFIGLLIVNTNENFLIISLTIFVVRYLIQMLIFNKAMQKLGEKDLLVLAPILEIELLFFYPFFVIANLFSRKKK